LGVATTVPSVLLPEYWAAVIARGGPAMQRLRPHLWPHVYAELHHASILGSYIYDSAPLLPLVQPQPHPQPTQVHPGVISSSSGSNTPELSAGPKSPPAATNAKTASDPPASHAAHDIARQAWTTLDWLLAAYRPLEIATDMAAATSTTTLALLRLEQTMAAVASATASAAMNMAAAASTVPDGSKEPPPEEEEKASSQALLILVSLLIAALLTSYYLQRWRIRTVHETVLSIFAGMVVGLILRFNSGSYIQRMVTFDHTVFFNMLLPPIILNCGYNLQKTSIARNIPSVLTFAFIGTAISAVVIGVLVQIYSFTGIENIGFSLLDSLILGTILSATDPVTILAVFEQLRVDPKLFSIIFGETVFNDAVAIVLFVTLSNLRASGRDFTLSALPSMLSSFMFVFSASLLVGVAMGVFMALLCKHARLYEYPSIEASLVLLLAYQAYLFSNAIDLSGIVSLLFCAATMRQYAYRSLSIKSKRATRYLFHLLSGLAENFVFIYLGISLFTSSDVLFRPVFIIFVMISTCISRYSAIFPLSRLLNAIFKYRHPSAPSSAQPVTHEEQTMLFWAGLRGAVAVALASEVSGTTGPLLRTTVLCVVVLSVTIFGGTTPQVVHQLGIRTGVPQPDSSDEDDDGNYDDDDDGNGEA
ncbi:monovalent cation:H+ antiporter, CPA1 (nhx1), partial [Coemansia sp. RSA 25]